MPPKRNLPEEAKWLAKGGCPQKKTMVSNEFLVVHQRWKLLFQHIIGFALSTEWVSSKKHWASKAWNLGMKPRPMGFDVQTLHTCESQKGVNNPAYLTQSLTEQHRHLWVLLHVPAKMLIQ